MSPTNLLSGILVLRRGCERHLPDRLGQPCDGRVAASRRHCPVRQPQDRRHRVDESRDATYPFRLPWWKPVRVHRIMPIEPPSRFPGLCSDMHSAVHLIGPHVRPPFDIVLGRTFGGRPPGSTGRAADWG